MNAWGGSPRRGEVLEHLAQGQLRVVDKDQVLGETSSGRRRRQDRPGHARYGLPHVPGVRQEGQVFRGRLT